VVIISNMDRLYGLSHFSYFRTFKIWGEPQASEIDSFEKLKSLAAAL